MTPSLPSISGAAHRIPICPGCPFCAGQNGTRRYSAGCDSRKRLDANRTRARRPASSREIAQRAALSESTVYHVIADLFDAVEFEQPSVSAVMIHERTGTRPATADEVAQPHAALGPFETDNEG